MDQPQLKLPLITPDLLGISGSIKQETAHFVVEELPLYEPQGHGAHLYIRIEREGMTTREVVKALAREFALDQSQIGYAGLKDKEARCTQTFSLTLPDMDEAEAMRKVGESQGLKAHWAKRHGNKLKRGHLLGNRFQVLVSGVGNGALNCAQAVADALNERGLPNYFGEQRFGAAGDNAQAGRRALKSRGGRGTKNSQQKWMRSLMLNAYQSELFNRWLAERVQRGEFGSLLMGDVAKKTDTGGLFEVEDPAAEQPRLDRGEITYTGPIYGHKMRSASGLAGEREIEVLEAEGVSQQDLKRAGLKGSRRPARLLPGPISITPHDQDGVVGLWFSFALPKGAYATTLLREFIK
jgi:tRNA pseudouridine13 synthase